MSPELIPGLKCCNIKTGIGFEILKFPDRKQTCLCLCKPGELTPIAYFKTDEYAKQFILALNDMINAAENRTILRGGDETERETKEGS